MKSLRDPMAWLLAFTGILLILTPLNILLFEVGKPFGGFFTNLNFQDGLWRVDHGIPPWWSGPLKNDTRPSDGLISINGQPYNENANRIFLEAQARGDTSVLLEIRRESTTLTKRVTIEQLSLSDFSDMSGPDLINSLCYWLVAWGIYRLRPKDRVNRVFVLICCAVAASQSLIHPSFLSNSTFYAWFANFLWAFVAPFVGVTIFHFATSFPVEYSASWIKWLVRCAYIAAGLTGGAFVWSRILFVNYGISELGAFFDKWCFPLSMVFLFFGWATFFVNVVIHSILALKKPWRIQPHILVAIISVFFSAMHVIPISLQGFNIFIPLFPEGLDVRYFLVSVPVGFAFISLRYKAFRSTRPPWWLLIPLIVCLSALFASVFTWAWWRFFSSTVMRPPFGQLLVICLILSSFWNLLSSARGALARLLNWEAINFSFVQQFSQELVGNTNLASLPKVIVQILADKLRLEQTAIWLWDDNTSQFELMAALPSTLLSLPQRLQLPAELNLVYSQPFRLGNEQNLVSSWLKTQIDIQNWEIALPLGIDRPIGIILLGQRLDDEIFDERDLNMFELIARQATLFLFSAQVTYWLDKAQEDERFRIAQDLHDTIQQSLNAVAIHLHMIQKMAYRDVERTELFALECQNDIKDAIRNLYEIRSSLDPNELAHGLVEPLHLAIERVKRIRGLNTSITLSSGIDKNLSALSRRAVYRMIKQALDNTLTHADARNFNVRLEIENDKMCFYIEDDGKGSTPEQRMLALSTGHMGLKTMRTRIESLGGEFVYNSKTGAGTQITGWIPVTSN